MKPVASLSLDLDNKWSYLKTHGDAGWETFPSYLDVAVPRILAFLKERGLTITFFVVGQDSAFEKNWDALRAIAQAGHEIGNHSFNHEPWLHLYSEEEIETELAKAEESIEHVTGQRPVGFRGPGYSLSAATLDVLVRRGYEYDATTFPNSLNPLARAYYFMHSRLSPEELRRRKALFGTFRDAFRPLKPYRWKLAGNELIEIPVTTMPLLKTPVHFTYLIYLAMFAPSLATTYFRTALSLCRWTGTAPSLLFHPLDFLGCDDDRDLGFFPGMTITAARKLELLNGFVEIFTEHYTVVAMRRHAQELRTRADLPKLEPRFVHR